MINGLRKYAYTMSALAVACFFLAPNPTLAIVGALLLQTLAFIVIAGKSLPDGILLSGITLILIGLLPDSHPIVREVYFSEIKVWFLIGGITVALASLLYVLWQLQRSS